MAEKELQTQINEVNQKLDLVLQYVEQQRLKNEEISDLVEDVNIIGRDLFKSTVEDLDHENIIIDPGLVKNMIFRMLKNLQNINNTLEMLESMNDLLKDIKPITRDFAINTIHKVEELEAKGYIDFAKEGIGVIDNIITNFSHEDVKSLADNVVTIVNTVKNLTQPDMLAAINNAVNIYKHLDINQVEPVSLWKAMREMNSPEMRKGLGFMITFLKSLSEETNNK